MAHSGRSAVIIFSGGLDSTTLLAMARAEGSRPYALTFDYGQRHRFELEAARRIASRYKVERHLVYPLHLNWIGGSALTEEKLAVPKDRSAAEIGSGVPITYVPARNLIFLSIAAAWAEVLGAEEIHIGVNALDYSGYPDCRPAFIDSFQRTVNLGTAAGVGGRAVTIRTPLIDLSKAEIIRAGIALGVDYAETHSCYDPSPEGAACGACDSCQLRRRGFAEAGVPDPTRYAIS